MAIGVTPVYKWFTTMAHHTGIEKGTTDLEKQITSPFAADFTGLRSGFRACLGANGWLACAR
jgi:hypothetical protein